MYAHTYLHIHTCFILGFWSHWVESSWLRVAHVFGIAAAGVPSPATSSVEDIGFGFGLQEFLGLRVRV